MRMRRRRLAIFEWVVYQNVVGEVAIAQRELTLTVVPIGPVRVS